MHHWLSWDELDNGSITRLDKFGACFDRFTCPAINLLDELGKLASDVGGMAI